MYNIEVPKKKRWECNAMPENKTSEKKAPVRKAHRIVSASETGSSAGAATQAAPVGSSKGYRVGAVILWIAAIACEVMALLVATGKMDLHFIPTMWQMIGFLVLDLIFLIIGSQLWKKANHISPMSKKNKALFWLWNNLGLVVAVLAFVPFIIILATNKDADPKLKKVGIIAAVVALVIGGLASYDWNPVSAEEKNAAEQVIQGDVFWTNSLGGKVYHIDNDCHALNRTEELVQGKVAQAIAANRSRVCYYCAGRHDVLFLLDDPIDSNKVVEYLKNNPAIGAEALTEAVEDLTETIEDAPAEEAPAETEQAPAA